MKIELVNTKHWVCSGIKIRGEDARPDPRLPKIAQQLWRSWGLISCDGGGVIATEKGKLVAFFRYDKYRYRGIFACGTWVDKKYQGRGLATKMWGLVLEKRKVKRVSVTAVSRGGKALAKSLRINHPDIKFKVN